MFHVARAPRRRCISVPAWLAWMLWQSAKLSTEPAACSLGVSPRTCWGGRWAPSLSVSSKRQGLLQSATSPLSLCSPVGLCCLWNETLPRAPPADPGCRRRARFHSSNPTDLDLAAVLIRGRAFFPEGLGGRGQSRRASRGQQLQGWWESEEDSSGTRIGPLSLTLTMGGSPQPVGREVLCSSKEPSEHTRSLIFQNKFSKGSSPSAKTL